MMLLSTLHDPEGRFFRIKNIENILEAATKIYEKSLVNVTNATDTKTKYLVEKYFTCIRSGTGTQGEHMIALMKNAANSGKNYHYCDFDRLVHWQMKYPNELKKTLNKNENAKGFVFICRTKRAFDTHPETQKDTEAILNIIVSNYLGKSVDIGSGSYIFDSNACKLLSRTKGNVHDVRFLAHFIRCLKENKVKVSTTDAEGMEWETPDIHQDEIKRVGYGKWLSEFQSHKEWQRRVDYIRQFAEVLSG